MSSPKDFDCANCDHRYCGEEIEGSNGDAPYPKWNIPGVGDLRSCPLALLTDETNFYLRMHKHYVNGILLVGSNALLEQPNKYLEAMEILG